MKPWSMPKQALKEGDHESRQPRSFAQILEHEPDNFEGDRRHGALLYRRSRRTGAGTSFPPARSRPAQSATIPAIAEAPEAQIELAEAGPEGGRPSRRSCAPGSMPNPKDFEARFALAAGFVRRRRPRGRRSINCWRSIQASTAPGTKEAARKELVKFFEAMSPTDPLTLSARRRLSSIPVQLERAAARPDVARSLRSRLSRAAAGAADLSADRGPCCCPSGRLPLTIFEPRYLAMTRHALAANRRASSAWCSRWRRNADRNPDADRRGRRC